MIHVIAVAQQRNGTHPCAEGHPPEPEAPCSVTLQQNMCAALYGVSNHTPREASSCRTTPIYAYMPCAWTVVHLCTVCSRACLARHGVHCVLPRMHLHRRPRLIGGEQWRAVVLLEAEAAFVLYPPPPCQAPPTRKHSPRPVGPSKACRHASPQGHGKQADWQAGRLQAIMWHFGGDRTLRANAPLHRHHARWPALFLCALWPDVTAASPRMAAA